MSARWQAFLDEWRTFPWTPRARRIGHAVQFVAGVLVLVFGAAIVEGIGTWLVS
jgi:hypothetical protein